MTSSPSPSPSRAAILAFAACALALTAILAVAASLGTATAAPSPGVRASLETSAASMPATGTLGLTAVVSSAKTLPLLQVRFQLHTPDGHLVLQRTFTDYNVKAGSRRVSYSRPLADLTLPPGAYRADVIVRTSSDQAEPLDLSETIFLYGVHSATVPVVLVARVSGQTMRDPQGTFVVDPSFDTRAVDDAASAASLVITNPKLRMALAVPPMLLEEWRRISLGYDLSTPSGIAKVAPTDPTPLRYAAALDKIEAATKTGRLELLAVAYTDPDPTSLARAGLLSDITPQFRAGLSATFASLGTSPSAGAMFAGGCLPAPALPDLTARGISYAILSATCVRSSSASITTGAYPLAKSKFKVLVADRGGSAALSSNTASPLVDAVFDRAISPSDRPFIAVAEMGPGRSGMAGLVTAVNQLGAEPWATFAMPSEVLGKASKHAVKLLDHTDSDGAPPGYWAAVVTARRNARAFIAAVGEDDAGAQSASYDSFVAESASWAGADKGWAAADRGLAFASSAVRAAKQVLGTIRITASDVTLSGSRGTIPVTVRNGTTRTLTVVIRTLGNAKNVDLPPPQTITLRPADNYVTLPIDLRAEISANLVIVVESDGMEIARDTVTVHASYLDRVAIVGGIVVLLAGLLIFIVVRVRRAEAYEPDWKYEEYDEERYTGDDDRENGAEGRE